MDDPDAQKRFYRGQFMDLSDYTLERGTVDGAWDDFVDKSLQGTLFSQSPFLDVFGEAAAIWYCLKGRDVKAGVALLETTDGTGCFRSGLLVYTGILFAPFDIKQGTAQIHSEQFRITSFMVDALTQRYRMIAFALSPTFGDLRPFLWHHYGTANPKFRIDLRYTSLLDIASAVHEPPDESALYRACNKSRRQEIRYARRAGAVTREYVDHELFRRLYLATFAKQGLSVPEEEQRQIFTALRNLEQAGKLRMFFAEEASGRVGSVAVFGIDAKRAYYLFGANDREVSENYTGTAVLWDAFQSLARSGVGTVDLEGVNSPERGYFKLSFGGSITPYHAVFYPG